jgi:hypothetical protein
MIATALLSGPKLAYLIREGYFQLSFYGDDGEWTKDRRIEAIDGYLWHLDRMHVPRNSELRLKCTIVSQMDKEELMALLLKRSKDSGGHKFAKM